MSVLGEGGRLTEPAMEKLEEYSTMIECQCPSRLVALLREVREFEKYTMGCIQRFPADAATHQWLANSALNIDHLLSSTLVQLARMEGFIGADNGIRKPEST